MFSIYIKYTSGRSELWQDCTSYTIERDVLKLSFKDPQTASGATLGNARYIPLYTVETFIPSEDAAEVSTTAYIK